MRRSLTRPAFLVANSGQQAWVSSQALAAAHMSAATPDPPNGRIERNARGEQSRTAIPGARTPKGGEDHAWNPGERVSLEQAIVAYTSASAYLLHDEQSRGSLAAGKAADLVVLGRDLFDTPPLEIHDAPVDMTIVAGEVIFERHKRRVGSAGHPGC